MQKTQRKPRRKSVASAERWYACADHLLRSLAAEARELRSADGVDGKELDALLVALKDARSSLLNLTPRFAAGPAR